jgi:hypothetical protein
MWASTKQAGRPARSMRLGQPRPRSRRATLFGALLLALSVALPAAAQLEPGKRIKGHKSLDCQKCHISGSGVGSNKCLSCHTHKPLQTRIRAKKGLHGNPAVRSKECAECHLEHKGRNYDPIDWKPVGGLRKFARNHGKYAGYELEGAHRRVDCKDCHTAKYKESKRTKFLGLDSDCLSCHEDVHRFRRSHKSLLDCKICHTFDARTVSKAESIPRFKHGKIADFPLNGKHNKTKCTNCHTSTKIFKLRDRPDRCVDCHKDVHENVYTIRSRDCDACHSDRKMKFTEKVKWNHGRRTTFDLKVAHRRTKCVECHDKRSKAAPKNNCTACHLSDSVHVVGGKDRFKGRDCGQCHTDEKREFEKDVVFNHLAQANFNLAGAHGKLTCVQCHRVQKPAKLAKTPEQTFEKFKDKNCIDCHAHGNEHEGQFNARPQLCAKCHKPGFTPDPDKPGSLPPHDQLSPVFAQQGAHAPISCAECHGENLKKLDLGDDCSACHMDDDAHAGNLGTSCKQCHFEGYPWSDVLFNHNQHSEYALEGKHQAVACDKCHPAQPKTYKPTPTDCISCHAQQDVHEGALGTDCLKCHDMHGTTAKFDHNSMTSYVLEGSHARADCAGCHFKDREEVAILDYKFAAQGSECRDCHGDPHGLQPGAECQGCHDLESFENARNNLGGGDTDAKGGKGNKTPAKVPNPDAGPDAEIFKSPDHSGSVEEAAGGVVDTPVTTAVFKPRKRDRYHDVPPFSLRDGHAKVDCARCHGGRGDMQGFGKMCDTCHRTEDIHAGSLGPTCADCHSQRAWFPSSFTHTTTAFPLVGPHRMISCKQCHMAGNYMGLSSSCVSCHLDDAIRAETTSGTPHAAFVSIPCLRCHNQTSWMLSPFLQRRF